MLLFAAFLIVPGLFAPIASAQPPGARPSDAPRAQVRFAIRLTRTDGGGEEGASSKTPKSPASPQVIGTPVVTTLEGGTGSISVSGGDISYSISLSPTLEANSNVALLWNLQISGKSLPGATSVNLNGASRVVAGKEEPVAEVTLKDPKTGRQSSFHVRATTTITGAVPPAPKPGS
jgi:hypothetical protein